MKVHITKQGESIDTIANKYTVSKQDLTGINPHVNLSSDLVPGLKLKIPDASRTEKNEHIEKFYPNLDHEKFLKEQAVPIGLKPFESPPVHGQHGHTHGHTHHPPHQHTHTEAIYPEHPTHSTSRPDAPWGHETPWGHLGEHTTHLNLNPETPQHYPWNHPSPPFSTSDARAIFPPIPYYPPYYPYGYGYGYGYPYSYPYSYGLPFFGFGPGYGYGGYGFGHGFHGGGGHFGGHGGGHGHR